MQLGLLRQFDGLRVRTRKALGEVPPRSVGTLHLLELGHIVSKTCYSTNCCQVPLYSLPVTYDPSQPPLVGDNEVLESDGPTLVVIYDKYHTRHTIQLENGFELPDWLEYVNA